MLKLKIQKTEITESVYNTVLVNYKKFLSGYTAKYDVYEFMGTKNLTFILTRAKKNGVHLNYKQYHSFF